MRHLSSFFRQAGFSPDGKMVFASSLGKTRFYRVPSLQFVKEERADRYIFAPDGDFVILVQQGKTLRRELATGAEMVLGTNAFFPFRLAISPDGKTVGAAGDAHEIALWHTSQPGPPIILRGHSLWVASLAFSPDGKLLASASSDGKVGLWDVATQRNIQFLRGHNGGAWSVAFSFDGKTLASSSDDNTVKLWNLTSMQEAATLHGHKGAVSAIAFSPDGKELVSVGGWAVRFWHAPTLEEFTMVADPKKERQ